MRTHPIAVVALLVSATILTPTAPLCSQELPEWERYAGAEATIDRARHVGVVRTKDIAISLGGAMQKGTPQVTFVATDQYGIVTAHANLPQGDAWGWVDSVVTLLQTPVARSDGESVTRSLNVVMDFSKGVAFGVVQLIDGAGVSYFHMTVAETIGDTPVVTLKGSFTRDQFMQFLGTFARATDVADSITAVNRQFPYTPATSFLDRLPPTLRSRAVAKP